MRRLGWLTAAVLFALAGAPAARAAPAADASYSVWDVQGNVVRLLYTLPVAAAKRLVPNTPRLDAEGAAAAAGPLLSVSSASGDCPAVIQNQFVGQYYVLAMADGAYRFETSFQCSDPAGLALHDKVLFDQAPAHVDYAKVQVNGAAPVLRLFTREHQAIAIPSAGALKGEGPGPFARQGLERLLQGADAAALALGLLLLARRWRDLGDIAAALGLGYLIALALVLSGRVAVDLTLAAAGAGLAAALLGVNALRQRAHERMQGRQWGAVGLIGSGLVAAALVAAGAARGLPTGLAAGGLVLFGVAQTWIAGEGPRPRLLLFGPAVLFGVLDGASWAQTLAPLRLPGAALAAAAFGYDAGAFFGLAASAALVLALLWLGRRRLRPILPAGVDLAAAVLTGVGLFWFVSRLYSV
jgi:hypothetical protein